MEAEMEAKRNAQQIRDKEGLLDKRLHEIKADLDKMDAALKAKNLELLEKENLRKRQEDELKEKSKRLTAEELHRKRGAENAMGLTDDLMEEVARWKRRFSVLRVQQKLMCPRCTAENPPTVQRCEVCESYLLE
eukprot:GILJ01021577.1.p1 GENE.GILJ01021577.1~~GILJ01021577.1.p1  ORF type:complete len:134 (-),score=41.64 GILJ01021577.1:227-628(-)